MCGYFCTLFIEFMFGGKILNDFTNLFSRHDFKKNDKIVLNYFNRLIALSSQNALMLIFSVCVNYIIISKCPHGYIF